MSDERGASSGADGKVDADAKTVDDSLGLTGKPRIVAILEKYGQSFPDTEDVVLSGNVIKINRRGKSQQRVLLLTSRAVYNLTPDKLQCKRRIPIAALKMLSASTASEEFVLHVKGEYDYRYRSARKQRIVALLCDMYAKLAVGLYTDYGRLVVRFRGEANLEACAITRSTPAKRADYMRRARDKYLMQELLAETKALKTGGDDTSSLVDKGSVAGGNRSTNSRGKDGKAATRSSSMDQQDFVLLKVLGRGISGKVLQVRHKNSGQIMAMKVIRKRTLVQKKMVRSAAVERAILQGVRHPFLMSLVYAFQSETKLYLVMNFCKGGELFFHLKRQRRFAHNAVRLYIAEIALALGHLHAQGYVYRDLKPENVLLDEDGHVCLTDFGLARQLGRSERAYTFCGSPDYFAPELLAAARRGYGQQVDWWSLGILAYELRVGIPPFYDKNPQNMQKNILTGCVTMPTWVKSEFVDLVLGLLARDPSERLGSKKDVEDVKGHPFFTELDWKRVYKREYDPEYKPTTISETDTQNFDSAFTAQALNSVKETGIPAPESPPLHIKDQGNFEGFSFAGTDSLGAAVD